MQTIWLESVDSTNDYAKRNAPSLLQPTLIVADAQTNGKGRRGRSFFSPRGTGLYMTLLLDYGLEPTLLTVSAGVAAAEAIERLTGVSPQIKWVNDLYLDGKKFGGILAETFRVRGFPYYMVGLGINLTTADFPSDLPHATALHIDCDRSTLAHRIADEILELVTYTPQEEILARYRSRLCMLGRPISYERCGREIHAVAQDIDEKARLIVRKADGGTDLLAYGEISIHL
ncbi:MAG: biotin--[Clostridia bacterium]|nr:biotin--[acetyl-CoA-carboxylase] ligase [Clostridia bacterium]